MRICKILFLLLVLITASCQQSDPPNSIAGWKEFTSQEDNFVVSFPTYPKIQTRTNQYNFGMVTIKAYTSNPNRNVIWRVATHNYPEPYASQVKPVKLIEQMRDGMTANIKGKVEDVKKLNLDGYPGQEFVVRASNPLTNKPLMMKVRLYAANKRVYQIMVIAPLDDEVLDKEASQFFKSFRFIKK